MDLFKEYGITRAEAITTLSDAINFIDSTGDDEDGLSDRLFEVLMLVKKLTTDYIK